MERDDVLKVIIWIAVVIGAAVVEYIVWGNGNDSTDTDAGSGDTWDDTL